MSDNSLPTVGDEFARARERHRIARNEALQAKRAAERAELRRRGFFIPPSPPKTIDMMGFQIGSLTVIARAGVGTGGAAQWRCRCVCGGECLMLGNALRDAKKRGGGERLRCPACRKPKPKRVRNPIRVAKKRCGACGLTKDASAFHRCRSAKDGLQSVCKKCQDTGRAARMRKVPRVDGHRPTKICRLCCNLPHAVKGDHCAGCGLERQDDP